MPSVLREETWRDRPDTGERTGSQIAAAFGEHTGLPARYEALPLQVRGDDADTQAMFR
jgi:hypothetical protein